jgi:hypothetical protein
MVTVLRDPVRRSLSHYRHARRLTELESCREIDGFSSEKVHRELAESSLEKYLFTPSACSIFGNIQALQLATLSPHSGGLVNRCTSTGIPAEELYELAMEGLSMMQLVGTTQKLDEFMVCLADVWQLPKPIKKYVENADPSMQSEQLSQNEIERIRELCAVDLKIYEYVNHTLLDRKSGDPK